MDLSIVLKMLSIPFNEFKDPSDIKGVAFDSSMIKGLFRKPESPSTHKTLDALTFHQLLSNKKKCLRKRRSLLFTTTGVK